MLLINGEGLLLTQKLKILKDDYYLKFMTNIKTIKLKIH